MNPIRRFANSLVLRIIGLGMCLVFIGTAGRTVVLSRYLGPDLIEQSGLQLLALSESVATQIDRSLLLRREALHRMAAQLPAGPTSPAQTEASLSMRLAGFHALTPLFSEGLVLLDAAGQVLASSAPELATRHAGFLTEPQTQEALQAGFAIGRPAPVGVAARAVLPMFVPVPAADGLAGTVLLGLIALDAQGFIQVLQKTRVGQVGGLVLVSPQDGLFLSHASPLGTLVPTPAAGQPAQLAAVLNGARGVAVHANDDGADVVTATALVPSSGWLVVAHQPTSEVLAPMHDLQHRMVVNSGLIVIFMVVVLVTGLRYLFKPLVAAADHADKMTLDGEPLAHLPVVRHDEVGHLTAAFNRLLDKLSDTQAALSNMAHHDTLTGLPNRTLLADVLSRALVRAQRNGTEVAVLFLDLDGFKPINDAHGHATGDEALKQVAQRLTNAIRQADTVARIGGDEFVILLSDLPAEDRSGVAQVAAKCLDTFALPFTVMGHTCQLGASVGIAMGHGALPPDALMSAADTAMYSAKQAGKGQVVWGTVPG